jgi:hypothetical protein
MGKLWRGPAWLYSYTVMCVAVQFVVEGKTRTAAPGVLGTSLPVPMRSGQVKWVEWGAPARQKIASSDSPGHIKKLPVGNWVDLTVLRSGDWVRYRPRPVRIVAIAFGVYLEPPASPGFPLERWISLATGRIPAGRGRQGVRGAARLRGYRAAPGRVRERAALLAEDR